MDINMNEDLFNLLKEKENKICFDCGNALPKWASINNGIFICLNCAGQHRGLGVQISFVRSVSMDSWEKKHIEIMKVGGNKRLKEVMQEFGIPLDMKIETKYKLKALDYYRQLLKAEAFGEEFPEKPDLVSAFMKIEEKTRNDDINNDNFISSDDFRDINTKEENKKKKEENEKKGRKGSKLLNNMVGFFTKSAKEIKGSLKDLKIEEKAISFKNRFVVRIIFLLLFRKL